MTKYAVYIFSDTPAVYISLSNLSHAERDDFACTKDVCNIFEDSVARYTDFLKSLSNPPKCLNSFGDLEGPLSGKILSNDFRTRKCSTKVDTVLFKIQFI